MKTIHAALIPAKKARALIDLFEIFVHAFCPDYGPLRSVFQLLTVNDLPNMPKPPIFAANSSDKTALQDDWSDAYKNILLARTGMSHWDVQLIGMDMPDMKRTKDKEFHFSGQLESHFRYYTDSFGRPVIYFDRSAAAKPSYMAVTLAIGLSKILLATKPAIPHKTTFEQIDIIHSLAAFFGMGLVPLLDPTLSVNQRKQQVLTSMLYLRLKGYSMAKIKIIYGQQMDSTILEQLEQANHQLSHYAAKIDALRAKAIKAEI